MAKINAAWCCGQSPGAARLRPDAYVAEASPSPRRPRRSPPRAWTFLTNHAQVLLAVAKKSDLRVREIAAATGITERYAYRILRDLERAGYVDRRRHGRSNVYRIHPDVLLGDPLIEGQSLWQLLRLIGEDGGDDVDAMSLSRPRSRIRPWAATLARAASVNR
jgi:DNA-binding transcriptional ArsR family regulator